MGTGARMPTGRLGTGRLGTAMRGAAGTAINTQVGNINVLGYEDTHEIRRFQFLIDQ
jgi:hypothetical protein